MRRHSWFTVLLVTLSIMALGLSACQSSPAPSASTSKPEEKAKTEAPAKPAEQARPEAKPAEKPKTESQAKPAAKEPYKIGVSATLSGPLAAPGLEFRDGILLEVERVNAAGGVDGHLIELIVEDDGADPTRASTALTKLIRQDKVLAVLGPWGSFLEPSAKAMAEREQVAEIVPSPTMAEIRAKNYKWSFNLAPNEIIAAAAMVDILKDKGYKKVVVVAESTQLMQSLAETLRAGASREGIEVAILPDTTSVKDVDVTPQLTKLKDFAAKEKPQAVVLATSASAVPFIKGMKQLAIGLPVVGSHGMAAQPLLDMLGNDADGVLVPGSKLLTPQQLPDSDPQKAVILDFEKRFVAKYNKKPFSGSYSADAISILANALKVAGPDRAKIRDAIEKTTNFVGVTGVFNYKPDDHEGLTKQSMAVYEIKDKKFVFVRAIK